MHTSPHPPSYEYDHEDEQPIDPEIGLRPGPEPKIDTAGGQATSHTPNTPGTIHCPRCHSPRTSTRNIGRKVGGTIGTAAGAASGISRVLAGAEIGATLGIWAGPAGPLIGGVAGAVLSGLFGGAAGCALGATLGEVIDHTILDNHRCHSCSHHFSVPPVDR